MTLQTRTEAGGDRTATPGEDPTTVHVPGIEG